MGLPDLLPLVEVVQFFVGVGSGPGGLGVTSQAVEVADNGLVDPLRCGTEPCGLELLFPLSPFLLQSLLLDAIDLLFSPPFDLLPAEPSRNVCLVRKAFNLLVPLLLSLLLGLVVVDSGAEVAVLLLLLLPLELRRAKRVAMEESFVMLETAQKFAAAMPRSEVSATLLLSSSLRSPQTLTSSDDSSSSPPP